METKPIENIDDETLLLADQAEKAIKQLDAIVRECSTERWPPKPSGSSRGC
jgi:hypothetical protein